MERPRQRVAVVMLLGSALINPEAFVDGLPR